MPEGELRLDPTPREEEQAKAKVVFSFSFGVSVGGERGECVGVDSIGVVGEEEVRLLSASHVCLRAQKSKLTLTQTVMQLFESQDLAQTACQAILAFMRKSIETRYGVQGKGEEAKVKPAASSEVDESEEDEAEDDEMEDA